MIREVLRLIVIDDDQEWCELLKLTAQSFVDENKRLKYDMDMSSTLEEAKRMIQEAEQQATPYTVAIVDMNFEMGKKKIEYPRGKEVVQYIKTNHTYMACIMVSGSGITPETVLELRDDYNLDYYVSKDRFDRDAFGKAIEKAIRRVHTTTTTNQYEQKLRQLLKQWRSTYLSISGNLAAARQREALKGIDTDIATLNEIKRYRANLQEAQAQIASIEQQLASLTRES